MKKKILVGAVILVVIAGIVLGFTLINKKKGNGLKYRKEAVKKGNIQALVTATGTLNPVTLVDVGSQVSGKIAKIYVDFNSEVEAGQIVAELDQEQFRTRVNQNKANYKSSVAALEKAKVTMESADRKYQRALSLFEKNLISFEEKENSETQYYNAKADLQSQEARLEQAKSQLDSSRVDLAYTIIRSPIDGIVITRNVNEGQTVAASFQAPVLFQIANTLSQMQVECSVDEADIGRVKEDQKVTFTVDAFPNDSFSGKVTQVRYSPEVVQNVVTYTTIIDVDNPELKLRPGMTAIVSIVVGEAKNKLLVPNTALRFAPDFSQEEMMKMFEEMRAEWQAQREQSGQAGQSDGSGSSQRQRQPGQSGGMFSGRPGSGAPGSRMQQFARVWIETEEGKLRPVMVKPGVTDNTFTELVWGNLTEGQEVITGQNGGSASSSNRSVSMGRGMMFIRR